MEIRAKDRESQLSLKRKANVFSDNIKISLVKNHAYTVLNDIK
jgi:hypothetical protein